MLPNSTQLQVWCCHASKLAQIFHSISRADEGALPAHQALSTAPCCSARLRAMPLETLGSRAWGSQALRCTRPAWAPTPKNLLRNYTAVTPHPPATITDKMQDLWVSPRGSKHSSHYNTLINCSDSIHALFLGRIKSDYYSKFSLIQQTWLPKNFNARNVLAHSPCIVVGCSQEHLGHTSDIQPTVTCKMQNSSEVYLSLCTSHCIETSIT